MKAKEVLNTLRISRATLFRYLADGKIKANKIGGRYWCYVEEVNDLGVSHYQWNCSYNESMKVWGNVDNGKVLYWTNLLPNPPKQ